MKNRKPKISKDKTSKRVKEEQRNVRLRAFIYAASREADNKLHLIVGHNPDLQHPLYMTMELSGLPATSSSSHAKLKAIAIPTRTSSAAACRTRLPSTSIRRSRSR